MEAKILGDGVAKRMPIVAPMDATFKPSRRIICEMSEALAPKARRMPIS